MNNDWFHEYFINELKAIGRKPTSNMQYEVVDSLPSSGNEQTIYFVKNDSSSTNDYYDEYVWISSSSAFEKIGSTQIDGSTTQPDWNQNDDTQPDHIKNRPFYTDDPVETVLVEENTLTFEDGGKGIYASQMLTTFVATVGEIYKVYWDGTAYECACINFNDKALVMGNLSIAGGGSDTGEPFYILVNNGRAILIATADTASSHTISISRMVASVVKIDAKYLPTATNDIPGISKLAIRVIDTNKDYTKEEVKEILENINSGLAIYYLGHNCIEYAIGYLDGSDGSSYIKFYFVSGKYAEFTQTSGVWNFNTSKIIPPSTISIYHEIGEVEMNLSYNNVGGYIKGNMPAVGCGYPTNGFVGDYIQANSAFVLKMHNATKYLWIDADRTGGLYVHTRNMASTSDLSKTQIAMISDIPTEGHINELINTAIGEYADTVEYIIPSSTSGSTKKFKITVDDSGTLSATEVT